MNKEARKLLSHNSFRFRYVSRGEEANALACLSVRALRWCHPKIRILIIDANDTASIAPEDLPGAQVIHLPPADDAVSAHVGRGTPHHLFYWRHSPQVLAALPGGGCFDVYIDCDIIPLRPMPLGELAGPLQRGRIAAAVDEDTPLFLHAYESKAFAISRIATGFREIGPLIQSGLVFSNPLNDGGMYRSLWKMAEAVAEAGLLKDLPYDDMSLFTVLMSQGGALWERFLPLGHHWNFITELRERPRALRDWCALWGAARQGVPAQKSSAIHGSGQRDRCVGQRGAGQTRRKTTFPERFDPRATGQRRDHI